MYGYQDDDVKKSPFNFGLNAGVTNLMKFEYTDKGGKDGAEAEALDIVFKINGKDVSYRKFPVTRAYDENNNEVTDPSHEAFRAELQQFNSVMVHIIGCFVEKDDIKAALSTPISSFKEFCNVLAGLLPAKYNEVSLDIFMQYQYNVKGENDRTYLEVPKNMKHGKWLRRHVEGDFKKIQKESPSDDDSYGLYYEDADGVHHPFTRTGWYMNSPFANQIREESTEEVFEEASASAAPSPTADAGNTGEAPKAEDTNKDW